MKQKYQTIGAIDKDGCLKCYKQEINDFFRQHKGTKVVIKFEVLDDEPSASLKAYYYKVVVPTFVQAFWERGTRKTQEDVEYLLRTYSPIMIEEEFDKYGNVNRRIRRISEVTHEELCEHIETLKQIAAEELGVYIEDPRMLK